jgi:hypothetical protein
VPAALRASASELRDAIKADKLGELLIWYVHNCPESKNVSDEMSAVEHTASAAIQQLKPGSKIKIIAREFGAKHFARLYRASGSPIMVTQSIKAIVPMGYKISGGDWSAFQTFLPGSLLYKLYSDHSTDLFSANVRDYLGSRDADSNINSSIKETAHDQPENFWVYNNGLTALVNGLGVVERKAGGYSLTIKGISIVNGAQTTGALGSLAKKPKAELMVPVRFIWTKNKQLVQDIIRFNNSQNKISASDFRSTDAIQKRLKDEFASIPDAEYEGGRRGGASDAIKRRPNLLPSYSVGQALAAFHGEPAIAYDRKSEIWVSDRIYSSYFKEETTAKHIVFAYALYKAMGDKKLEILGKLKNDVALTQIEMGQQAFFERKGSILLACAAVAECLEVVLSKAIPNKFRLSFGDNVSPKAAEAIWSDVLTPFFAVITTLDKAFSTGRISGDAAKRAIPEFRTVVQAVAEPNKVAFSKFTSRVKIV